jgi:hypothetical protein
MAISRTNFERPRRGCDQCEVVSVNGVACHEHGCPNRHLDPTTGRPYPATCEWCSSKFDPEERGQDFCDEECAQNYNT